MRPDGIYVSEFLIQEKLMLFHQVRIFAKANINKIEQVFTRNGNVFYKDTNTKEVAIINDSGDLCKF